jgi:hypothetical protein
MGIEEKYSMCRFDIQIPGSLANRYNSSFRYQVRCRGAISGYKDIDGENFDVVHDIGAMSGYKDIEESLDCFCRYLIRYAIPGASGRTGHVPAPPTGPASWSSTLLDGLYSCVIVYTPFPAPRHAALREMWVSAAFCCCNGPALVCWTAVRWAPQS